MKFITENDLRDCYKKKPFTSYDLEEGSRLTPGAKQFLSDKGIYMFDDEFNNKTLERNVEKEVMIVENKVQNNKINKLSLKVRTLESLFLITSQELLSRDVYISQELINLVRHIEIIQDLILETLNSDICHNEIELDKNIKLFSDEIEEFPLITSFHIQLPNGDKISKLNYLRCLLQELVLDVPDYTLEESENKIEKIIKKINYIINTLSKIICAEFGGDKC